MTSFQAAFDKKQKEHEETLKVVVGTAKAQTTDILDYLNKKHTEVEKLWGIIGKASTSGNSQSYANKAKNYAHTIGIYTIATCLVLRQYSK